MTVSIVTGKPGHGKTLYAVTKIQQRAKDENRQVFYNGIPDLKLNWQHLDDATKWHDPEHVPDGAIVVIDESQRVFPPRATGSKVPPHVQPFDTHRHRGLDIYLITQDPMLIDSFARNLAGEHIHVLRPFGTQQAKVYRWEHVVDPDSRAERNLAVDTSLFRYPKEAFGIYKSATVHTVKRQIPWKLAVGLPVVIVTVIICGAIAVKVMGKIGGKKDDSKRESSGEIVKTSATERKVITPEDYEANLKPRLASYPESAPMYDGLAKPAVLPVLAGCVQMGDTCRCYTQQATRVDADPKECAELVASSRFIPYEGKTLGLPEDRARVNERVKEMQKELAELRKKVREKKPDSMEITEPAVVNKT